MRKKKKSQNQSRTKTDIRPLPQGGRKRVSYDMKGQTIAAQKRRPRTKGPGVDPAVYEYPTKSLPASRSVNFRNKVANVAARRSKYRTRTNGFYIQKENLTEKRPRDQYVQQVQYGIGM